MIPSIFSSMEAAFLIEYRALCERYGICPIVEIDGQLGLLNVDENRIWGCTAGQMVDKQIEAMAETLRDGAETLPILCFRLARG